MRVETGSQDDDGEREESRRTEGGKGRRRVEYREGLGNGDYKAEII